MDTEQAAGIDAVEPVHDALAAWQADKDGYLSHLDDSAFVSAWAAVRHCVTRPHGPDTPLRYFYTAMHAEFLRRVRDWGGPGHEAGPRP